MVTLTLPHSQMCLLRGALNFTVGAMERMPAILGVPVPQLTALQQLQRSRAWDEGFDAAALGEARP